MDCSSNQDSGGGKPLRFQWLELGQLTPNPWNPNRMSPAMVKKLSAEIKKDGMILPIVVRPEGEAFQIIDGEHRWLVAKSLGLDRVPCVVVEMNDAEARLKTIQLNRLKGEDDTELLARLLRELDHELGIEELTARLPFDRIELEQSLELLELRITGPAREQLDREMAEMLRDRLFSALVTEAEKAVIERALHLLNARAKTSLRPGSALAKICEKCLSSEPGGGSYAESY